MKRLARGDEEEWRAFFFGGGASDTFGRIACAGFIDPTGG